MTLIDTELEWLRQTCPFLKPGYLDYLSAFRFKPDQVHIRFVPISDDGERGNVEIEATGPWLETIFWEVPLMACLSETYFRLVMTDWSYDGQVGKRISLANDYLCPYVSNFIEIAYAKAHALLEAGCVFSEFGTRRRRSFYIQDLVVQTITHASKDMPDKGMVSGTSNVRTACPGLWENVI
jgi:nicotinate phosphoribosyltransferase